MTIDETSFVQDIASLADGANGPAELDLGRYYVVTSRDGQLHKIDLTGEQWQDAPKRKVGNTSVRDVPSFATYWTKHADGASEVYANRDARTVTAVLDANTADGARWGQHRLHLQLQYSTAWKAWTSKDGQPMGQEEFAEFLEDNRADIVEPAAAEMLEIASSLSASTKANFESGITLSNGQRKLSYVEETTAKAGTRGDLTIPTEIRLGIRVFEGAEFAERVTARFRYRINSGKLSLHYKLDRPADVIALAFEAAVNELADACDTTVMRGAPA